jgi:hypothetical protein
MIIILLAKLIIPFLLSLVVGSGFLNLGCKIVKDRAPGFAKGLLIVFLASLIHLVIASLLGTVLGSAAVASHTPRDPMDMPVFSALPALVTSAQLAMALSFVINAFLFKAMVPLESVGKGFLVSLIYSVLWAILLILLGVVMARVFAALLAGG